MIKILFARFFKIGATAPILTKRDEIKDATTNGPSQWLFAVNTGLTNELIVSGERNISSGKSILLGVLSVDPSTQKLSITWDTTNPLVSDADLPAVQKTTSTTLKISDHWHIGAHGTQYIAFSTSDSPEGKEAFITKFTCGVSGGKITSFHHSPIQSVTTKMFDSEVMATNDLFLTDEKDGVTVGVARNGGGHKLFRYDTSLFSKASSPLSYLTTGFEHSNGASARLGRLKFTIYGLRRRIHMIAPQTLSPASPSKLMYLANDVNWIIQEHHNPLPGLSSHSGHHHSMATMINPFKGGYIITYKDIASPTASSTGDDSGEIMRLIYDSKWNLKSEETLSDKGNNPHTEQFGNNIITTWREEKSDNSGGALKIRIDEINYD